MTLVRASGVAKRFGGRQALAPLDLELGQAEAVALVGPNGAGKSTLISLLACALKPSAGRVEWAPGIRVGWAPQRPAQYGRLSARENLELFARLEGSGDPGTLLDRFELPSDRPSEQLSVGSRQRLNVAIALLGDPDVLLLDEPTASLDPAQRRRLWETAAGDGRAVLFATQHLEEAERHADRVVALRDGELVSAEGLFE
ncbi:MAG: ABC transporter ATP-binding protein [Thermoleophilia bacterium]|nr:ABC transporter ATP-binding protein [Thermoleophilia bacterium]